MENQRGTQLNSKLPEATSKNVAKVSFRFSCHFKQIDGDECFAYHFTDKKECETCWKRYRFISEYLPKKQEYDEMNKNDPENIRKQGLRRFMNWGGTVIESEVQEVKTFERRKV